MSTTPIPTETEPTTTGPSPEARPAHPGPPRRPCRTFGLIVLGVLSLGIVGYAAITYGGLDPDASRVGLREAMLPLHFGLLMAHIITGAVALGLGPLQFWRGLRARRPAVHRWVGRSYLFLGVLPSAIVGMPVALLSTEGPWGAAGLFFGDVLWLATGIVAYRLARQRRYREHGRWMSWNFALTFAAVTFRIWLGLLILAQLPLLQSVYGGDFDALFEVAYGATAWLAFLPNVLIVMLAQRLLARRRVQRV